MKTRIATLFLFLCILCGCSNTVSVQVEIDNPRHREVYLGLLDKNRIQYRIGENNVIYVDIASQELLAEKMKGFEEFEEFVAKEIEAENEQLRKR